MASVLPVRWRIFSGAVFLNSRVCPRPAGRRCCRARWRNHGHPAVPFRQPVLSVLPGLAESSSPGRWSLPFWWPVSARRNCQSRAVRRLHGAVPVSPPSVRYCPTGRRADPGRRRVLRRRYTALRAVHDYPHRWLAGSRTETPG